ncbi:MAG: D-alanine--D-alanine ligase family protein [Bacteroidota bacterium]
MNVALVYNVKKEHTDCLPSSDEASEPPSTIVSERHRVAQSVAISDTYAEWDTMETILAVKQALEEHHDVTLIEADEHAYFRLRSLHPDIVFNMAEGIHGIARESQIPAMLEFLQIPYTGSDPLTLAICLDKARAKEILSYYGIPTPRFVVVHDINNLDDSYLQMPVIVKPLHEGSSKGIFNSSVVYTHDELLSMCAQVLEHYGEPALVEEFLPGREFTVALLGNGADVRVLPIVEINFGSLPPDVQPIYSFEAKWIWDQAADPIDIFECPASIPDGLRKSIELVCLRSFAVLRCRDWCRIDVRLDAQGVPNVLELNPLPGVLPDPDEHSCFPMAAFAAGMSYNEMINAVLDTAIKRLGLSGDKS